MFCEEAKLSFVGTGLSLRQQRMPRMSIADRLSVDEMNEREKPILRRDIYGNGGGSWEDGWAKCEAASSCADVE